MLCFYSISTTIFKFVSFLIFALFLLLVTTDKAFEAAGIPREFYARSWHISNSLFSSLFFYCWMQDSRAVLLTGLIAHNVLMQGRAVCDPSLNPEWSKNIPYFKRIRWCQEVQRALLPEAGPAFFQIRSPVLFFEANIAS